MLSTASNETGAPRSFPGRGAKLRVGTESPSTLSPALIEGGAPGPTCRRTLFRKFVNWVVQARSHRVLCLLSGLWLINGFDVVLTVLAHRQGMLHESNPIAAQLLPLGAFALLVYKVILVTFASTVLIIYRSRLIAEIAATGTLLIYTLVALQWRLCYEMYVLSNTGNPHIDDIEAVNLSSVLSHMPPL